MISNWGLLQSTASQITSAQDALEANRIALEGVREEEKVGQRTTLDVLNAELEYLGSQIQLVTAKRDRVVAEYAIYASIGRLDAQSLGLSVPYYDPLEHYEIIKNKWFGLDRPLRRPRTSDQFGSQAPAPSGNAQPHPAMTISMISTLSST